MKTIFKFLKILKLIVNHESDVLKSKDDELKSEKLELIKLRAEKNVLSTQVDKPTKFIFNFVTINSKFLKLFKILQYKTNLK